MPGRRGSPALHALPTNVRPGRLPELREGCRAWRRHSSKPNNRTPLPMTMRSTIIGAWRKVDLVNKPNDTRSFYFIL